MTTPGLWDEAGKAYFNAVTRLRELCDQAQASKVPAGSESIWLREAALAAKDAILAISLRNAVISENVRELGEIIAQMLPPGGGEEPARGNGPSPLPY